MHSALCDVWTAGDAWRGDRYVLMPDLVHLFCAPVNLGIALDRRIRHWKRAFTLPRIQGAGEWQRDFWDTRLRRHERYAEKNRNTFACTRSARDWSATPTLGSFRAN